MTTQVIMMKFW